MSSIDWPTDFDRTHDAERTANHKYGVSLSQAFTDLETELDRLGVDDYRYSFDADQHKTDQRPYARLNPGDPGFVLRWTMDGDQYAVTCDRYTRLRDNVRTVGLYLNEKRKMEQRPVETGESDSRTPASHLATRMPTSSSPVPARLGRRTKSSTSTPTHPTRSSTPRSARK